MVGLGVMRFAKIVVYDFAGIYPEIHMYVKLFKQNCIITKMDNL